MINGADERAAGERDQGVDGERRADRYVPEDDARDGAEEDHDRVNASSF